MSAVKLTLLHAGDILLDTPFAFSKAKESERRRATLKDTFDRLLSQAKALDAAVVLLTGNLFDNEYASSDTVAFLTSRFAQMPAVRFLIAAGPKDAAVRAGLYSVCHLPKNVTVFEGGKTAMVSLSDDGEFTFGGWSYDSPDAAFYPLKNLEGPLPFDVLGGYATMENGGVCISESEIAQSGAKYIALSGKPFDGFKKAGNTVYAYSGFLESAGYGDVGFGGANLVRFLEDDTIETERISLGELRYAREVIDVSAMKTTAEADEAIAALIAEKGYGEETALRIVFEGHSIPDFLPPLYNRTPAFGVAELCTVDRSLPDKNEQDYAKDLSVHGELVRAIMPHILKDDTKTKENAARALRITFSALDNDGSSRL